MALQSASWGFTCGRMEWPIRVEKYGLIRGDGLPGRARNVEAFAVIV